MLLLVNCKSIYGTGMPQMSSILKRMGHEIVVMGSPDDFNRGEIMRAESVILPSQTVISEFDTTESRRWAMLGAVEDAEIKHAGTGEALVISDDPRDRAAADSLNIVTVSPFDFGLEWVGEEIE